MMQRILITGSSGFIGSSLCAFLKNKDVPCLGVSRTQGNYTDILIKSYKDVIKYNDGKTLLINLAGNNSDINDNEIDYTIALSNEFKSNMIFMSSAMVYGRGFNKAVDENEVLSNLNQYCKSKIYLEKVILKNNGLVIRLSNIYGKGMSPNNIFSYIHSQLMKNNKDIVIDNIDAVRDFLYIDDLCECLYKIISGKIENSILNVGAGIGTDIKPLFQYICSNLDIDYNDKNIISNESKNDKLILDIKRLSGLYNWTPKTSIEKGIDQWLK